MQVHVHTSMEVDVQSCYMRLCRGQSCRSSNPQETCGFCSTACHMHLDGKKEGWTHIGEWKKKAGEQNVGKDNQQQKHCKAS